MKRSGPLKRKKSLGFGGKPLPRYKPLRGKPKPMQVVEFNDPPGEWYDDTMKQRCVVCGKTKREAFAAGTRLQGHHAVPQQTLRRRGLVRLLWDKRNGLAACAYPCHSQHTTRVKPIPRALLPQRVLDFAAENGLSDVIERLYPDGGTEQDEHGLRV